ncbi:putative serine/threonine-protein kinase PIX7, partial [Cucurbita argyrosperma subsp. argyrosperma]
MSWFCSFCNGDKRDKPVNSNTTPDLSTNSTNTDVEVGRFGSEFTSQNVSNSSSESSRRNYVLSMSERASNLRVFTVPDLKSATKNFSRTCMVGEGGFGCVYRGSIKSADNPSQKVEVAVKQLGYCADDDERGIQRLLVYEFLANGSVSDHLSSRAEKTLSWAMRLRIARDAACGLTYLHEELDVQIIFRDFKSSNILLDEQWNAKLSDFGLARLGPPEGFTHVSTAIVGTMGYAAPEYIQTGHLTSKTDVWSYGVFLYELLTGRAPIDQNRPKSEQKLLGWVKPYLTDIKKFQLILDPRLKGKSHIKSAYKLSSVANRCLVRNPKNRPKMSDILEMVGGIADAWTETGNSQSPLESCTPSTKTPKVAQSRNDSKTIDSQHSENGWFRCLRVT